MMARVAVRLTKCAKLFQFFYLQPCFLFKFAGGSIL